ncbi:MAG: hypothetical protein WC157_02045 [Candidatus Paceibacterota bacterium]
MENKILVAINFNNSFKKKLTNVQKKIETNFLRKAPVKWTRQENLFLYLGYTEKFEKVIKSHKPFSISFNQVDFCNKMIWIFGEENKILKNLQNEFEISNFIPHITLGRLQMMQFNKINKDEIPQINDEILIDLRTKVKSIEFIKNNSLLKNIQL